jgi:uncharacterized protein with GYD domain
MPKYLFHANYVDGGVTGLLKEGGTSRYAAVEELTKSLGGTLETFYYAFGETDAFVIVELPRRGACPDCQCQWGRQGQNNGFDDPGRCRPGNEKIT